MSARDPRDLADIFAREPAAVGADVLLPAGTLGPAASTVVRHFDGTFTVHIALTFRPHDPCTPARRPEVDPQPVG